MGVPTAKLVRRLRLCEQNTRKKVHASKSSAASPPDVSKHPRHIQAAVLYKRHALRHVAGYV